MSAECYGDGINMWLGAQGDKVKIIEEVKLSNTPFAALISSGKTDEAFKYLVKKYKKQRMRYKLHKLKTKIKNLF